MEFKEFKGLLQENFKKVTQDAKYLFEVGLDKNELWELYLDSFPRGTNNIFRERREFDCNCCKQFIRNIGNAVIIKDNEVKTIWDFETNDEKYQSVIDALSKYVKSKNVSDIFISKTKKVGVDKNFEEKDGKVIEWQHLFLELPDEFTNRRNRSIESIKGEYRDTKSVFKRSLGEITEESILTILELIAQNSLYKGKEWERVLNIFLDYKKEYDKLKTEEEKEIYAWEKSVKAGASIGRIRNHSMGTLLVNISEGMELDLAVKKYEAIVAPSNYKRPKAIFTKKMLEDAKKTIEELGYLDSLNRRYATLDDITVNNILFSNKDSAKRIIGGADIFDEMLKDASTKPKKFSKVEEISVENFIENILPTAKKIEAYFENKHVQNMVSLIAPENKDSKTMFKWNNGFCWAYTGNISDSNIKENVKSAGGRVDGDLRFSIQWNDLEHDTCDLDAHCKEPSGEEIYFSHAKKPHYSETQGQLDVDIIRPQESIPAVENITWASRKTMDDGVYKFFVHNYSGGNKTGFRAEIEFDGQIHSFDYNKPTRTRQITDVAHVELKNGIFTITNLLPSNLSSKEVWNLKTNSFVPVSVVMYSPNYWDEQRGIGHRHYFFMLKDCINSEHTNGFFNEYLKEELTKHKRVFEALGGKMAVMGTEDQLSGIGFSSTKRNELIVKVEGQTERVIKIKF